MQKYSSISDDAGNGVISNWEQNVTKALNLTGNSDMLKKLHQNSGTTGGVYEGLNQPHMQGWYLVLGLPVAPVA